MTTMPSVPSTSNVNELTVTQIEESVNMKRRENNQDFLDSDNIRVYLNNAIDELNADDDFKGNKKIAQYAIDTSTSYFYLFSTLFPGQAFERMETVRPASDPLRGVEFSPMVDYAFEPDINDLGQGIRFLRPVQETVEFIYYTFIPRVDANSEVIQVTHLANTYFIAKVLQYVYESEMKHDLAQKYEGMAMGVVEKLQRNNTFEYDDQMQMHSAF